MHSITGWKLARRPNYNTNIDKVYPYSEAPFLGEYHLVKIPVSHNELIELVDYWGEGKIVTNVGNSGFSNCYNVNHTYQLVSNGPDVLRKIPNRIPVVNYTNCDTSSYIKDNSVKTVTIMGAPINSSCAKDIARMVNTDFGKVFAYDFDSNSQDFKNLTSELKKKALFHCPNYTLPDEYCLSLFDSNSAFLNLAMLKDELYKNITNGSSNAVDLSKNLDNESGSVAISDVVTKLISAKTNNIIMAYAYKLWHSEGKDIVRKNFPAAFKHIFDEDVVTIINVQYQQALKLDATVDSSNNKLARGDSTDKISKRVSWKIIPVWDNDNVAFELYNIDSNMYLKLDANVDSCGHRKALGSTNNTETRHRYYLEPSIKEGTLAFRIIHSQYHQELKMDVNVDSLGDRQVWGDNGDTQNNPSLKWIISENTKTWVKEVIEI